ncbi:MAG: fibro-slime domain-containing protein [Phycisphaerales bacterium]
MQPHPARTRNAATLLAFAGLALTGALLTNPSSAIADGDQFADLPPQIVLTGVVRDFKERSVEGGHPDFEKQPNGGFGHYTHNVSPQLAPDGKPVYVGNGNKVGQQFKDSANRPIAWTLYNPELGDIAGSFASTNRDGGIQSSDTFDQWFRNTPGVNLSKALDITLVRQPNSNVYVFDDRNDPAYSGLGGFFPINNQLFGNSPGNNKNFHFTYELATEFIYKAGQGHVFKFRGDDDVWVFINGQLVIDLGGVHSAIEQTVELDRLEGILKPNQTNTLHFFFAERHRTQSNFRIETTLNLRSATLPTTAHIFD